MNNASRATYIPLVEALLAYERRHGHSFTLDAKHAVEEIQVRLQRLDRQYERLLQLNEELRAADPMSMQYDAATGYFDVDFGGGLKQSFKIPGVSGPMVKVGQAVDITAFDAGKPVKHLGADHAELRVELEEVIESYYYGAHRLTVLVRAFPNLKRFSCREMIAVRNGLLEHTRGEPSYNFGYGTGGPFVRPARPVGHPVRDKGAVANTIAFVQVLERAFAA